MAKKKKGELPSGNIRRQVYLGSKPVFDENGKPVIDPKTGKQKKKRIYKSVTESTPKKAEMAKAQVIAGKEKVPTDTLDLTLTEAIDKYIASSDALLSPPTIRGYRTIQRNAFSNIMGVKLSKITNELLREAVNMECKRPAGQKKKPLTPKTVKNEYGLLSAVLNIYAPGLDCSVKLPQIEHNKNEISKPDVIYNIVKGTEIELPVLLAMWLSLTESEIAGLTKSESISSDGNYIKIKNVIVYDENHKPVIKNKGKQPARDRTLRIPDYIKTLINKVETDKIVTLSGNAIYKRFRRMIINAGIPYMTFHDLRHVNASVMALLNVPDKYAQERGGWSSDHIMKSVYQQTFSTERVSVDEQIDAYFNMLLFNNDSERRSSERYACWLTLFDRTDSEESQNLFAKFCSENAIIL